MYSVWVRRVCRLSRCGSLPSVLCVLMLLADHGRFDTQDSVYDVAWNESHE